MNRIKLAASSTGYFMPFTNVTFFLRMNWIQWICRRRGKPSANTRSQGAHRLTDMQYFERLTLLLSHTHTQSTLFIVKGNSNIPFFTSSRRLDVAAPRAFHAFTWNTIKYTFWSFPACSAKSFKCWQIARGARRKWFIEMDGRSKLVMTK